MVGDPRSCPTCQKSFSRLEHLRRHTASHSQDRYFRCTACDKPFARKDTLRRHKLTHQNSASLVHTKGRACASCVTAKARCSGSRPCDRCRNRGVDCGLSARSDAMESAEPHVSEESGDEYVQEEDESDQVFPDTDATQHIMAEDFESDLGYQENISGHNQVFQPPALNSGNQTPLTPNRQPQMEAFALADYNMPLQPPCTFDANYWTPNVLSNINWLPNETVNLDYAERHDLFPFFASIDNFSPEMGFSVSMHQDQTPSNVYTQSPNSAAPPNNPTSAKHAATSPYVLESSPLSTTSLSAGTPANESSIASGEYYVDGSGARLPKVKRRKLISSTTRTGRPVSGFSLECPPALLGAHSEIEHVDEYQYQQMRMQHQKLCLDSNHFGAFTNGELLARSTLSTLVHHYLEHFHPILPFLHRPTFRASARHFIFVLAMAALGSHFAEAEGIEILRKSLNEFVRRLLLSTDEASSLEFANDMALCQTQLLHSISLKQSGSSKQRASSAKRFRDCTTYLLSRNSPGSDVVPVIGGTPWQTWVMQEEATRTKLCVWLLDSMVASHAQRSPLFVLDNAASSPLPCHEKLWNAASQDDWSALRPNMAPSPTLQVALQNLYVEKRLFPDLGELASTILIHAIYHRTWEVQAYLQQGLSRFEPSAQKQSSEEIALRLPIWHPDMALFSKWRNSACDCLDILHWNANAAIGAASGIEHPTVLHLHFARVVLLSPLQQIIKLAKHFANVHQYGRSTSSLHQQVAKPSPDEIEADKQMVQEWVIQDQYKARLAAIHAGVSFWHVRRYSVNAFYEPEVIALSTLMLWAISAFSPKQARSTPVTSQPRVDTTTGGGYSTSAANNASSHHHSSIEAPTPDICEIILLDRPTDDELVQQFVRQGHTMHANMTGVGDLFGALGPERVIREGRKLLETLGAWRDATGFWLNLLERLESVTAKASANISGITNHAAPASATAVATGV